MIILSLKILLSSYYIFEAEGKNLLRVPERRATVAAAGIIYRGDAATRPLIAREQFKGIRSSK